MTLSSNTRIRQLIKAIVPDRDATVVEAFLRWSADNDLTTFPLEGLNRQIRICATYADRASPLLAKQMCHVYGARNQTWRRRRGWPALDMIEVHELEALIEAENGK